MAKNNHTYEQRDTHSNMILRMNTCNHMHMYVHGCIHAFTTLISLEKPLQREFGIHFDSHSCLGSYRGVSIMFLLMSMLKNCVVTFHPWLPFFDFQDADVNSCLVFVIFSWIYQWVLLSVGGPVARNCLRCTVYLWDLRPLLGSVGMFLLLPACTWGVMGTLLLGWANSAHYGWTAKNHMVWMTGSFVRRVMWQCFHILFLCMFFLIIRGFDHLSIFPKLIPLQVDVFSDFYILRCVKGTCAGKNKEEKIQLRQWTQGAM